MDESAKIFSRQLKAMRKESDLYKIAVAKGIGVSDGMIGHWERGESEPTLSNIAKLARFFNTTPNVLMGFDVE